MSAIQSRRRACLALLLIAGTALPLAGGAAPAQAAIVVYDPSNHTQAVLTAARALQQINNQIRSLQNEAAMLAGLAKNLKQIGFPELAALRRSLNEIDRLMSEARGIAFRVDGLDRQFRTLFPEAAGGTVTADASVAGARARLDTAMAALRHTMSVQARTVENLQIDTRLLAAISGQSERAEGALQVGQATNQLLALAAKQEMQLQAMMAADFRASALADARRLQAEIDARAATTRFLGSGMAYSPR